MNIIAIKGRLTKTPELRTTTSGKNVCTCSVAVDRFGDKTDFFTVVFWEKTAEFVSRYFEKGKEIIVTGEMQSREYTDKNGVDRTAWEIGNARAEFCGSVRDQPHEKKPELKEIEEEGELPF